MSSGSFQKRLTFSERLILAFANLTGLLICISLIFTVLMDANPSSTSLFEISGRFALFVALVGCVLVAASARMRYFPGTDRGLTASKQRQLSVASGILSIAVTAIILGFEHDLQLYEWIFIFFTGIICTILTYETTMPRATGDPQNSVRFEQMYVIYAVLAIITLLCALIRAFWPQLVLTNIVLTPLQMFLIPGLSLSIALLPPSASWIERIGYGVPLSLGSQLIVLMWLNWVGILVYTPTFFVISGIITLVGFLAAIYRTRRITSMA